MRPPREDTEPWYRQFWPWFLISLPLSVVIAAIYTINLAIETDDGLVSDDYYKEGLAIHKDADSSANARALEIRGDIAYDVDTGAISITLDNALATAKPQLVLSVVHPTLPNHDQEVQLIAVDSQRYVGKTEPLIDASWKLKLYPADKSWRIEGRMRVPDAPVARLD